MKTNNTVWFLHDWIDCEGGSLMAIFDDKPTIDQLLKMSKSVYYKRTKSELLQLLEKGEVYCNKTMIRYYLRETKLNKCIKLHGV